MQPDLRNVVHARQAAREIGGCDERAVRGLIGAHAGEHVDVEREKFAGLVERQGRLDNRVARLVVGKEALGAAGQPAHRPPDLFRGNEQRRVFGVAGGAHAKAAADIAAHDAHPLGRHAEALRDVLAQHEGALRGAGENVAIAGAVVAGQRAARLHRRHDDALVDEPHPRNVRGAGKRLLDVMPVGAGKARPVERDIARRLGPDLRRLRPDRGGDIGHRRAHVIIHQHPLGSIARGRVGFGHHQRHRVADMPHHIAGQRRARRHDKPGAVRHRRDARYIAESSSRQICGGQDREHAWERAGGSGFDPADRGEGVRRADKDGVRFAGLSLVVAEPAGAGQQPAVLVARLEWQAHPLITPLNPAAFP